MKKVRIYLLALSAALMLSTAISSQAQTQTSGNTSGYGLAEVNRNRPRFKFINPALQTRFRLAPSGEAARPIMNGARVRTLSLMAMLPPPDVPVFGSGTVGRLPKWTGLGDNNKWLIHDSNIFEDAQGRIGIGTTTPGSLLTVAGMIETTSGGFKFPDGTIQTTAAAGLSSVFHNATLSGNGSSASPLGVAVPLVLRGSSSPQPILTVQNDGFGFAIQGTSLDQNGLAGYSNTADGTSGQTNGANHSGVLGVNTNSGGWGVRGFNSSNGNVGYLGGSASGAYGFSAGGNGVTGESNTGLAGNFLGNVSITGTLGIGATPSGAKLSAAGLIQSTTGGFQFPDGTIQTTAATNTSGNFIQNTTTQQPNSNFNISGDGTAGGTLQATVVTAEAFFKIGNHRMVGVGEDTDADGLSTNTRVGIFAGNNFFSDQIANTYVGRDAGRHDAVGRGNTFLGYQAGLNNGPTGNPTLGDASQNTFVGNSAGKANFQGSGNAFFGKDAGLSNINGSDNTFIGALSGESNTDGQRNVFVGFAGTSNTKGDYNVFVGFDAGQSNITGTQNTLIGEEANVGAPDLSWATAIGSGAVVSTSETIVLGRPNGHDTVDLPGKLQIDTLAVAGSAQLCLNSLNRVGNCSSSLRYKTAVQPFISGLDIINQLRPITFTWKTDGKRDLGLGAEDVAAVEPLLITRNSDGQVEGVKYDHLNVVLINAIKQQQEQIKKQQDVIDDLKKLVCSDHRDANVCR